MATPENPENSLSHNFQGENCVFVLSRSHAVLINLFYFPFSSTHEGKSIFFCVRPSNANNLSTVFISTVISIKFSFKRKLFFHLLSFCNVSMARKFFMTIYLCACVCEKKIDISNGILMDHSQKSLLKSESKACGT